MVHLILTPKATYERKLWIGLSALGAWMISTWGVAPGCYGFGPLALGRYASLGHLSPVEFEQRGMAEQAA